MSNISTVKDDVDFKSGEFCKILVLYIDKTFSWPNHTEYVNSKLLSGTYLLKRLSVYVDSDALSIVSFSVLYPFTSYGLYFWRSTFSCHENKILYYLCKTKTLFTWHTNKK